MSEEEVARLHAHIAKLVSYIRSLEHRNQHLEQWLMRLEQLDERNESDWDNFCNDLGIDPSTSYNKNKGEENGNW